tara:strand:- start:408 stop:758 length:351 start_codon:yes stop_codon:yes gene_type:complete
MTPRQLQGVDLQNLAGMMSTGYAPEAELLNQLQAGTNIANISDTARRQASMERAESKMSGLSANLESQRLRGDIFREALGSAGNIIGGGVSGGGLFSSLIDAGGDAADWIKKILNL